MDQKYFKVYLRTNERCEVHRDFPLLIIKEIIVVKAKISFLFFFKKPRNSCDYFSCDNQDALGKLLKTIGPQQSKSKFQV
jgi:hypothetical protein